MTFADAARGGRGSRRILRRARRLLQRLAGAVGLALLVASCVGVATPGPSSAVAPSTSSAPSTVGPVDPVSGLRVVAVAQLPPEALATIRRIRAGGPSTDPADGAEFLNAAGVLPVRATGYYHAYGVPIPSGEVGADLIVAGAHGEMYWTTDGSTSFMRVVP